MVGLQLGILVNVTGIHGRLGQIVPEHVVVARDIEPGPCGISMYRDVMGLNFVQHLTWAQNGRTVIRFAITVPHTAFIRAVAMLDGMGHVVNTVIK